MNVPGETLGSSASYISFGGYSVTILADLPEVHAGIRRAYRFMMGSCPLKDAGVLRIRGSHGAYALEGNREIHPGDDSLSEVLRCARFEAVLLLAKARPDLFWIHAGAAALNGQGVLFVGPWGSGKSTIVGELCRRGWSYLSDDIAPIDTGSGRVLPFPLTPTARTDPGRMLPRELVPTLDKAAVPMRSDGVSFSGVPVSAFVFPRYDARGMGPVESPSPSQSAVTLLGQALNGTMLQGKAVEHACRLVAGRPVLSLTYCDGAGAADRIISALEEAGTLPEPAR